MKKFVYELFYTLDPDHPYGPSNVSYGMFTSLTEVRKFIYQDPDLSPENYIVYRHTMNLPFSEVGRNAVPVKWEEKDESN